MKSNLMLYALQRKHVFNKGLTAIAASFWCRRQKKSRKRGSQEFYREASNEVAGPLGKNPENWIPTLIAINA
jgi:hypothetical protein